MINFKEGSMFNAKHDCLVNTINCHGAMGAGIALEFKNNYPLMFENYKDLCREHLLAPGDAWFYEDISGKLIAGLAVKNNWKNRSRYSWSKMAVRNFVNTLLSGRFKVKSVGLPRIGSKNGGRGVPIGTCDPSDVWAKDSLSGYEKFEPFLLNELNRAPEINFTIYSLRSDENEVK